METHMNETKTNLNWNLEVNHNVSVMIFQGFDLLKMSSGYDPSFDVVCKFPSVSFHEKI